MKDRETCQGKSAEDEDIANMDTVCLVVFVVIAGLTILGFILL